IVVNLAPREVGHLGIEQRRQRAQDAAFGLAAQPQQDEIVARKDSVHQLRHHCVVIADDAGEDGFTGTQLGNQVVAEFIFDFARAESRLGKTTFPQLAQGMRKIHEGPSYLGLYARPGVAHSNEKWPSTGHQRLAIRLRSAGLPAELPNVDRAIDAARLLRLRSLDLDFAGNEAIALVLRFGGVAGDESLLHHVADCAVNLLLDGSNAGRNVEDVLGNLLASEFQRKQKQPFQFSLVVERLGFFQGINGRKISRLAFHGRQHSKAIEEMTGYQRYPLDVSPGVVRAESKRSGATDQQSRGACYPRCRIA